MSVGNLFGAASGLGLTHSRRYHICRFDTETETLVVHFFILVLRLESGKFWYWDWYQKFPWYLDWFWNFYYVHKAMKFAEIHTKTHGFAKSIPIPRVRPSYVKNRYWYWDHQVSRYYSIDSSSISGTQRNFEADLKTSWGSFRSWCGRILGSWHHGFQDDSILIKFHLCSIVYLH